MRQRTPLVVALVLVVGGLGLGELVPQAGAQVPDPIDELDHEREYKERSGDGYRIIERDYLLFGNGRVAGGTVHADVTEEYDFEAGNRKAVDFVVDPPSGKTAEFEIKVSYDRWEYIPIPGISPLECVKGSDVDLVVKNASGHVVDQDAELLNDCDSGVISGFVPNAEEGRYTAEVYSEHGANLLLNVLNIEVAYF